MTNQTIEQAVEEFEEKFGSADYGINKFRQFDTDGIFLQDGTDWLRQALQAQRDAGARERKGWKGYAVVDAETDYYLYSDFFVNKKDAVKYWKNEMSEPKGLVIIEVDVYPALTPPTK